MGTWGPDIFEDDLALDLKDSFEDLIEDGESPNSAVSIILNEFADALEDFDEGPTMVLALGTILLDNNGDLSLLKDEVARISKDVDYWECLKEESEEIYKSRSELLEKLLKAI